METKKSGLKKWILLAIVAIIGIVAAVFILNSNNNEAALMESFDSIETLPEDDASESDSYDNTHSAAEGTLPIEEKQLTKAERKEVMTAVIDAAKQDVAYAKEQLAKAKASGDTALAAEAKIRLDNMRAILKQSLKQHEDLDIAYPEELFKD